VGITPARICAALRVSQRSPILSRGELVSSDCIIYRWKGKSTAPIWKITLRLMLATLWFSTKKTACPDNDNLD